MSTRREPAGVLQVAEFGGGGPEREFFLFGGQNLEEEHLVAAVPEVPGAAAVRSPSLSNPSDRITIRPRRLIRPARLCRRPLKGASPPTSACSRLLQSTEKCPGADLGGIIDRSSVSNVTRPTASRWLIIR